GSINIELPAHSWDMRIGVGSGRRRRRIRRPVNSTQRPLARGCRINLMTEVRLEIIRATQAPKPA
ncbi:MAG TPA: hypothetical protein PLO41_15755, partial [Rubrivivax sp.]|nr:hypothetical protein [Rubrivivax sp.]